MLPAPLIVRTARLDLVATTLLHLDAELAAANGVTPHPLEAFLAAHVPASWPPGMYDLDAIRFFRDQLDAYGSAANGWFGWYAIARAQGDRERTLVASGGYFGPPQDGVVEIGYSVVPERRGEGIATELIVALSDRALAMAEVVCVVAHTEASNVASLAALSRAGFVPAGTGPTPELRRFERRVSI